MDNKLEILLGSQKNINSINVDNYNVIELTNNESEINEFTVNDVVNATELFDTERENNPIYRIYGRIEYLSLLNGLKSNYSSLNDFFNPLKTGSTKTIFNSFDFYLVAPSSGATYQNITNTNKYKRVFDVIADKSDFEIYNAGFSNNVYGEQTYAFSFKSDFDVSKLYDNFGFPLTELFLYVQYKMTGTETMSYTTWSSATGNPSKVTLNTKDLNIGNNVETNTGSKIYDIIEYIKEEYSQKQLETQKYYIKTKYLVNTTTKYLEWSYNPFIPFRLCYLDGEINIAKLSNIIESGTSLNVININNPANIINVVKSLKQNLSPTIKTITNWDSQSSTYYTWYPSTGILKFKYAGMYNINFKTQIYLSEGTDMYVAEIYLEERPSGGSWIEITGTRRRFLSTDSINGVNIERSFNANDQIRIRASLIPNPNERKLEIIPDYATIIEDEGRYVWRDIVPQGYTEPLTGVGVDYPFFNGKRYLFSPIILDVVPNLSELTYDKHANTLAVFNEISFSNDATNIDITPLTELNDIGKPCQ